VSEWSVIVYYTDSKPEHFIFKEKEAPTVMDCLKMVESEVQDHSVSKVILHKIGSRVYL
jgi:hypothetical protein